MSEIDFGSRKAWSFNNFAKLIYLRQKKKDADTFIILYGLPRSGKTTLGFRILIPYIKLMRKLHREGEVKWKPEVKWSHHFKKYFAGDSEDMNRKVKNNPPGSYVFIDEGVDVVSWMELMTREQRELMELIQKTGKRHMLTILITPSLGLLTKYILSRAHYMFIIIDEPSEDGNTAFVLRNYKNPFLAEEQPFGLKNIQKDLKKSPFIAMNKKSFSRYMIDRTRVVAAVKFKSINPKIYNLYDKLVKEPSIMRTKKRKKMVSYAQYHKIKYAFDTILYNLYFRDGKSIAQINRLLTDKFGYSLTSRETIQRYINKISALEKRPEIEENEEIMDTTMESKVGEKEDIKIEDTD
ncbi:hypothetical protein DRQ26_00675 [bacterium]|nr:MAG: hypothetical protein DRQ26_00675 [bacterium]